jgi:multiple sugar transport system permease protein
MSLGSTVRQQAPRLEAARRRRSRRVWHNRIVGYLFISPWLIGFLAFALYPFLASLFYSLTSYDILTPPRWVGLSNYGLMVQDGLFWWSLGNTLYFTVFAVPLTTVMAIAIAMLLNMNVRGLAFYRTIFYLPSVVPLVASSILWIWLFNLSFGLRSAFNIFLLRQFFMTIPQELSEAARVDGANEFTIYWRVILPLAKPALATVALFQFIFAWNDFLGPLIYLNDQSLFTVSLGLQSYVSAYGTQFGMLMAAATVATLPIILLFFLTQKTFIQGITMTGLKG